METVIVTRHSALVEWLNGQGITGEVISHATPGQVEGKHVYGALPFHLAAMAASVTVVDLPNLPEGKRGHELTAAEMEECGACLATYTVLRN
jgi:putative CRISPR-associated protein (TIGR02620 family)